MKEKYLTFKESQLLYKKINRYLKNNHIDLKLEDIIEFGYNFYYLLDNLYNCNLTSKDDLLLSIIEDFKYYSE